MVSRLSFPNSHESFVSEVDALYVWDTPFELRRGARLPEEVTRCVSRLVEQV